MNATTRARWLRACALGVVLATLIATWWLLRRERMDGEWVTHTEAVIRNLDALLADVIDCETAERGFVISGEPAFLEPYEAARTRFAHDVTELRKLTRDNAAQQHRLARAEEIGRAELAAFSRLIALRREDLPAAMASVAAAETSSSPTKCGACWAR
jgi:CHASE3 domain sensor protein